MVADQHGSTLAHEAVQITEGDVCGFLAVRHENVHAAVVQYIGDYEERHGVHVSRIDGDIVVIVGQELDSRAVAGVLRALADRMEEGLEPHREAAAKAGA